jgi:hypothetical protein
MAKSMMSCVRRDRRKEQVQLVSSFVEVCASLSLAVPDARFFLRRLHDCLSVSKATSSSRVLLSHQAIREVRHWSKLGKDRPCCPIWPRPVDPAWILHTDSSMEAWGATLQEGKGRVGQQGMY